MADKKISELDAITGSATAADDYFIVVDSSGAATKKISREELNNAIEQDVLSVVDINGGTIDGTTIGATTPAAITGTTITGTTLTDGFINWSSAQINRSGSPIELQFAGAAGEDVRMFGSTAAPVYFDSTGPAMGIGTATLGSDTLRISATETISRVIGGAVQGGLYASSGGSQFQIGSFTNHVVPFIVNGSEVARLGTSGNLGIGTSSPGGSRLAVLNGGAQAVFSVVDSANGRVQIGTTDFGVSNSSAADLQITNQALSGTVGMTFNVGDATNSGNIYWRSNTTNNAVQIVGNPGNNYLAFATSSAEKMRLDNGGNLQFNDLGSQQINWGGSNAYITGQHTNAFLKLLATGSIQFHTASGEKVRIISSGNVGIGESGPSARLHVKGAGTAPQFIVEETGANSSFMRIISDSGNAGLQFRRGGLSGTDTWTIYDSGGTLYVDDDSGSVFNVTPTALNIANAAGPALLNEAATSTNPTLVPNRANPGDGIGAAAAGNLHLITNGGNRVAIGGSGVVNILTAGSFGTPALSFNSDFDTGIYHSAADTLAFATGGGGRLTINTSTVTSGLTIDVTTASGPAMLNEAATSTNPTLVPSKADPDTGMGWVSADIGALVAGGAKALEWNSSSNVGIGASASTPRLNIQSAALGSALQLSDGTNYGLNFNGVSGGVELVMNGTQTMVLGNVTNGDLLEINTTTGSTGGTGSAGAGNQYVELKINGNRYKLLHDGTI